MKSHIEMEATHKGVDYKVILLSGGWRCGYVDAANFPGIDFEADIACHGGITYTGRNPANLPDPTTFWVGFDCAHCDDGIDVEAATTYWGRVDEPMCSLHGHVWTPSEVGAECRSIIDQLIELRRNGPRELVLQRDEIDKLLAILDNQSYENDWFLDDDDSSKVFTWRGDEKEYEDLEEHIHRMLRP